MATNGRTWILEIALGIVTIISLIVGGGVYLGSLSKENEELQKRMERLEKLVSDQGDQIYQLNGTLSSLGETLRWLGLTLVESDKHKKGGK